MAGWGSCIWLGIGSSSGLTRGLAAAHANGVLHRDIKPGNVIIGQDGVVKLLDFGVAKLIGARPEERAPAEGPVVERAATDREALLPASNALPRVDDGPAQTTLADSPYRGLLSFQERHRALFFGRSAEAAAIVERLRSNPMVIVAGDSGTGKSSLCGAGVLPLLADGALKDGRRWLVATVRPGRQPLRAWRPPWRPWCAARTRSSTR